MRIATWNVNGIRARETQLLEWIGREQPDVLCLQEIKAAPDQVPLALLGLDGYWSRWHGGGGYSGVALLVRQAAVPEQPEFSHPHFDFENRIVTARIAGVEVASVYVPNGGKDFLAKLRFLEGLRHHAERAHATGSPIVLCGDINITRTDMDVHPKERKPRAVGQLPEEREVLDGILSHGLVDVGRALDPDNDQLFTWWAPWRNMRQRNIGWRIDYILASESLAAQASRCAVYREVGTSDHGPVLAEFDRWET